MRKLRDQPEGLHIMSALILNHTEQHLAQAEAPLTLLYLQLKSVTLRDWLVFLNDKHDAPSCRVVTLPPDASLVDGCLELQQSASTSELLVQDSTSNIIGILNKRSVLALVRRHLRLQNDQAKLFTEKIAAFPSLGPLSPQKSPISSPVNRKSGREPWYLCAGEDDSLLSAFARMREFNAEFIVVTRGQEVAGILF